MVIEDDGQVVVTIGSIEDLFILGSSCLDATVTEFLVVLDGVDALNETVTSIFDDFELVGPDDAGIDAATVETFVTLSVVLETLTILSDCPFLLSLVVTTVNEQEVFCTLTVGVDVEDGFLDNVNEKVVGASENDGNAQNEKG